MDELMSCQPILLLPGPKSHHTDGEQHARRILCPSDHLSLRSTCACLHALLAYAQALRYRPVVCVRRGKAGDRLSNGWSTIAPHVNLGPVLHAEGPIDAYSGTQ